MTELTKDQQRAALGLPSEFDETMAALDLKEQEFVRHLIAGATQEESARRVWPYLKAPRMKADGLLNRSDVKLAVKLGKTQGAVEQISGLAYDLRAAHDELVQRIEAASKADQHSAVASMMREKMRLHKLIDNPKDMVPAGASFTLVIEGRERVRQLPDVTTIDALPVVVARDGDSDANS